MINQPEHRRTISCKNYIINTKSAIIKIYYYIKHIFKKDTNNIDISTENINQTLLLSNNNSIINTDAIESCIIINILDSVNTNSIVIPSDIIDENDLLIKMIDKKLNIKILYFALIINSDEIKKILEINNIDLKQIFSSNLTFKSEFHVTLWHTYASNKEMIQTYYNDIKNLIGTKQLITITKFSHNSQYGRFNISFQESNNLDQFYKDNSKSQPHITLVHPFRDAVGAGTFISTNDIDLHIVLETQVGVVIKNNNKIEIIIDTKK